MKYDIRGVDVDFPYEAYQCQLVYMEKVIEALQGVRVAHWFILHASLLYCSY